MFSKFVITPEQKKKDANQKLLSSLFSSVTPTKSCVKQVNFCEDASLKEGGEQSCCTNESGCCHQKEAEPNDAAKQQAPHQSHNAAKERNFKRSSNATLRERYCDFGYVLKLVLDKTGFPRG